MTVTVIVGLCGLWLGGIIGFVSASVLIVGKQADGHRDD